MKKKTIITYGRIRNLREDHDLSQKAISKIVGMSQTGYSKYETGENDVPISVLMKLAEYYQTSVDYILERTDVKEAYPEKKDKNKAK